MRMAQYPNVNEKWECGEFKIIGADNKAVMENKKPNLINSRYAIKSSIAARRYGIPEKWLKQQAKSGKIPALITDNAVVFDARILAKFLAKRALND